MCLSEQLKMLFLNDKYRGANVTNSVEDPFREIVGPPLIKELSSISLPSLLTMVIDKSVPKIMTDNIPQYSSYNNGTKRLINILRMAGNNGPSFREIGIYLLRDGKSDVAYIKYGENHAKLAREYGLAYFTRSGSCKVYLTKLGKIIEQSDDDFQNDILVKLSLRIPIIQHCFKNLIFSPKDVEGLLNNYLSKSTALRRKNNVLIIINMINSKLQGNVSNYGI